MIIVEIIYNFFALIAVSICAGFIKQDPGASWRYQVLQGGIFGTASVLGMLHPLVFAPGLIFDGRSVMLSLCGLFFGPVAAYVAGGMAIACRILQGGVGVSMGVLVILFSALLGAGFYVFRLRRKQRTVSFLWLWLFGILVHVVMLLCTAALPADMALAVLKQISFPVLLVYPLATVFIGKIILDVFERKRVEDALRVSEAKYRVLFEGAGDAIFIHDEKGRILAANPMACQQLGYTQAELLSMTVEQVDAPEQVQYVLERIDRLMGHGEHSFETVHRRKDGSFVPIGVRARRIPWEGQSVTMSICRDITVRKQAEELLRKAKEDAENATRAKSEFLNNVSHDFRTPMHAIMGFSDFLQSEHMTARQKKFAGIINESSKNLLRLVEDLLDVSRLEAGRLELRAVEFDPKKCVLNAVEVARGALMGKEVKMVCSLQESIPLVKGDDVRFSQILANLISNAVKYTDKGEIVVRIDGDEGACPSGKYRVRVSVKDTGLGISPDKLPKIFDSFSRFHEFAGGSARGGEGLGLYIVKTLIDLMKGEIRVASEVGKGSEFVVTLSFDTA